MTIRYAIQGDQTVLLSHDHHIAPEELARSIDLERIWVAEEEGQSLGWLRYNLFWDNTPFMNMLYVLEGHRGRGIGRALVECWETRMRDCGYHTVLTSTAADEDAQHFYHRLGYRTIGGFLLKDDPYETILAKELLKKEP